jgi:APA family basic amino acid/polyamine antiporter
MTPPITAETGETSGPPASAAAASGLVRELGTIDATMIVMGAMIGSGIFITSAESARLVGSPGWLLAAWALAGVMTIAGAISASEIAGMMPRAGGQYVFLREAYSPMFGFLFGWAMFLVVQTGTIAAVAVAFAKFLGVFWPAISDKFYLVEPKRMGGYGLSLTTQQLVALALIVLLTTVNTCGLKLGKWIQNSFTFTKTAALLGLVVLGLTVGVNTGAAAWTSSWWDSRANGWDPATASPDFSLSGPLALPMLLGLAMIGPLFSQSAWNNVTFTGSETRNPGRTLPTAMILGCSTVILLYLLANVAYIVTLPLAGIQHADQGRVGTAALEAILGPRGETIMAGAILISTFGCVNGLVLAGARIYYAMAQDGLFFRRVATTNRFHVPAIALMAQGLWASLLVLPVTMTPDGSGGFKPGKLYDELLEYVIPVDVTFYALMVGAVIALRIKAPRMDRPYRAIGYPAPILAHIGLSVLLVLDFIYLKPWTSGKGYLIVLAGIPVYLVWSRVAAARRKAPETIAS